MNTLALIIFIPSVLLLIYATIKGSKMSAQEELYWKEEYLRSLKKEREAAEKLKIMRNL